MRILVAGNEEVTLTTLREALSDKDQEVVVARDGKRAWRTFRSEPIRLVIAERTLPYLDGLSLCRRIRRLKDRPYTYVLLYDDSRTGAGRIEGLKAGADDILAEPIDPEELSLRLGIARRILDVHMRIEQANDRLAALATIDELTGLVNRREFRRVFEMNLAMALRQEVPLSLILLDIDHFKRFNDAFGHVAGDVALRVFAETVRTSSRRYEPVGRLGGEEFGIVLYGACTATARAVAQRIRDALARQEWSHRPLTASFGMATTGPDLNTVNELIEWADRALYNSKRWGRDCITHHDDQLDFSLR
jgi:diguanylate cyclase (GGDEF)-like protein